MTLSSTSRRTFLAAAAATFSASGKSKHPVGLELYSVRGELKKDLMGTVRAVSKMGYDGVEFFGPYADWTTAYAKDVRKLLDEVNLRCLSTHTGAKTIAEQLDHAIELNTILGSKNIVMSSAGKVTGIDGWKEVAERLNKAAEKMKPAKLKAGFHNHASEFKAIDGKLPMEVLAANTGKDVMLQLDVGTCIEAGQDPVAWINKNPGRIRSMHCKDWSPDAGKGYQVLFGEGVSPWKKLFAAAEKTGGIEYYLIEQEGSRFSELETAQKCVQEFKKLHS
jgi:sugar phosphate isomerase/epimerase